MPDIGRIIAEKLNKATGPVALALPLDGVSLLDESGDVFADPVADERLFKSLRKHLGDDVELLEIEASINDKRFA